MRKILFWPENQLKKYLYKKHLLEKDVQLALKESDIERVLRIVPKHSKHIFIKEVKKKYPHLLLS